MITSVTYSTFVPPTQDADDLIRELAWSIKWARNAQRLTQRQLADRMKTGQPAIARLESGDMSNIRHYFAALRALGASYHGSVGTYIRYQS